MQCKNLKLRTKKYKKYFYCLLKKQKIQFSECKNCILKEYKYYKKLKTRPIKKKTHKVSRLAKATDIPMSVKIAVYKRDKGKCILCEEAERNP